MRCQSITFLMSELRKPSFFTTEDLLHVCGDGYPVKPGMTKGPGMTTSVTPDLIGGLCLYPVTPDLIGGLCLYPVTPDLIGGLWLYPVTPDVIGGLCYLI